MPVESGELEILSRVEEPAVVLPEPFAVPAGLSPVPADPERRELCPPPLALYLVELAQHAVTGDGREIGAVIGHRRRVVRTRAFAVRPGAIASSAQAEPTC